MKCLVASASGDTSRELSEEVALIRPTPFLPQLLARLRSSVLPAHTLDEICRMIGTAFVVLMSETFVHDLYSYSHVRQVDLRPIHRR